MSHRRRALLARRQMMTSALGGAGDPGWLLAAYGDSAADVSVAMHFDQARYGYRSGARFIDCDVGDLLTLTRASAEYAAAVSGVLASFGAGVPAITDKGFQVFEGRTNLALWSRDLTNSAWTKFPASTTVAKDALGADGAANSATTITFLDTGLVAVQQSIAVSASTNYVFSFYAKAGSATGLLYAIYDETHSTFIAQDQAYTAGAGVFNRITAAFTTPSGCTSVRIYPVRHAGGAGTVVIDMVQLELGTFASPPIVTTSASVTRAADVPQLVNQAATAILAAKSVYLQTVGVSGGIGPRLFAISDPTWIGYWFSSSSVRVSPNSGSAGATASMPSGTYADVAKVALGMDASGTSAVANGGTPASDATAWGSPSGNAYLGNRSAGDRALNGFVQRFALSATKGVFDGLTA